MSGCSVSSVGWWCVSQITGTDVAESEKAGVVLPSNKRKRGEEDETSAARSDDEDEDESSAKKMCRRLSSSGGPRKCNCMNENLHYLCYL